MAFCGKCGATLEDGVTVCPACGAPVNAQPAQPTQTAEQPAQPAGSNVNAAVNNAANNAVKAFSELNNTKDTTAEYTAEDIETNKLWAILAYIGFLFFLPLVCCPTSKFGKYHANQGLVLFIVDVIVGIVMTIFGFIPILGAIVNAVLGLALLGMMIIGIVNAAQGKAKELPVIGGIVILK